MLWPKHQKKQTMNHFMTVSQHASNLYHPRDHDPGIIFFLFGSASHHIEHIQSNSNYIHSIPLDLRCYRAGENLVVKLKVGSFSG